ncbi:hypothetical protein PFISCL1PPCAC_8955, partial [Pristionchus fissidentatus]
REHAISDMIRQVILSVLPLLAFCCLPMKPTNPGIPANPGGGMPKACTAISQWPVVDCNAVYSGLFTCSAISINAAGITCPVGNFIMKGSTGFLSPTSIVCDSATGQYTTVAASETFNEAMLTTNIGAPFLLACIS